MSIHANFLTSSPDAKGVNQNNFPEIAFIGRSNVGKSSLLNYLTKNNNLAKISSKPGKTRLMNFFEINLDNFKLYFVDLPGYGYAKRSKTERLGWEENLQQYLKNSKNLGLVMVLIDINIPPQRIDQEFLHSLSETQTPFWIIFSKADKSKKQEIQKNQAIWQKYFKKNWEIEPVTFLVSSLKNQGREEILDSLRSLIR